VSGASPLKADVTNFDEEAIEEQFSPDKMLNSFYDKDMHSIRAVREGDLLMGTPRATGDNFYGHQHTTVNRPAQPMYGIEPTFGGQHESSLEDDGAGEDFEKISDFGGSSHGEEDARVGP